MAPVLFLGEHALRHEVLSVVLMLLLSCLTCRCSISERAPRLLRTTCPQNAFSIYRHASGWRCSFKTLCGSGSHKGWDCFPPQNEIDTREARGVGGPQHTVFTWLWRATSRSRAAAPSVRCCKGRRQHQHGCGDGALGVSGLSCRGLISSGFSSGLLISR